MFGNTADFLGKVKSELKKVTWPTKKETLASTQVVIILTLIVALYLWLIDSGLSANDQVTAQVSKGRRPLMAMKWYGVHTYSGYENKVKLNLEERIRSLEAEEFFGEILIPSETVIELKKGERKTSTRKFFPGYILVQMELTNETWHIVKNIPKVTGFVGGGSSPAPISEEEVAKITSRIAEGVEKPKPKVEFEVGETVRVVEGPFVNFTGMVEDVKPEKGKLKVMVSIFGRVSR